MFVLRRKGEWRGCRGSLLASHYGVVRVVADIKRICHHQGHGGCTPHVQPESTSTPAPRLLLNTILVVIISYKWIIISLTTCVWVCVSLFTREENINTCPVNNTAKYKNHLAQGPSHSLSSLQNSCHICTNIPFQWLLKIYLFIHNCCYCCCWCVFHCDKNWTKRNRITNGNRVWKSLRLFENLYSIKGNSSISTFPLHFSSPSPSL